MDIADRIESLFTKWEHLEKWDPANLEMTSDFQNRLLCAPTAVPTPGTAFADYVQRLGERRPR